MRQMNIAGMADRDLLMLWDALREDQRDHDDYAALLEDLKAEVDRRGLAGDPI